MDIIGTDDRSIAKAARILRGGGLVVYPSDTVYGALVDATDERAVAKLIAFKNRPPGKPISVFVSCMEMMEQLAFVDPAKRAMLGHLAPGPFTFIMESRHKVLTQLESEKGTIGIRFPDYSPVIRLVKEFGKPITATSANLSGRPPHYRIDALLREFPASKTAHIDLVVDAGALPRNKPSTILDLTEPHVRMLRKGDIEVHRFESVTARSPQETGLIAQRQMKRNLGNIAHKPLVFVLQGGMGAGKTVFVKAAGELLGIKNIVSPTFVIYYEYETDRLGVKRFIHCDLFNIEDPEEFGHLGLEGYLVPGTVLFIEWGEKTGALYGALKKKCDIVHVRFSYGENTVRTLDISS